MEHQITTTECSRAGQDAQMGETVLIADPNPDQRNRFKRILKELGYLTELSACLEDFLQSRPFCADMFLIHKDLLNSSEHGFPPCINKPKHRVVFVTDSSTENEQSLCEYYNIIREPVEESTMIGVFNRLEKEKKYQDIMSTISSLLFIKSRIDSAHYGTKTRAKDPEPKQIVRDQIERLVNQADTITDGLDEEEYTKLFSQLDSKPISIEDE